MIEINLTLRILYEQHWSECLIYVQLSYIIGSWVVSVKRLYVQMIYKSKN